MNVADIVRQTLRPLSERGSGEIRGPSGVNVHEAERAVSMLLGGLLVANGIKRRSVGGTVAALAGGELLRRGVTGHSNLYQKLKLHTAGGRNLPRAKPKTDELLITRAITIGKPADELYQLWRDPQTMRRIMEEFADITIKDEKHSHWSVRGPMDRRIEWDSEITEEHPGERIRWQTMPGAEVPNDGVVEFRPAPSNRGTEVLLRMRFHPPTPVPSEGVMKLLGFVPKQIAYKVLWRLKALAETGDIPSIKNQPAGRNDGRDR
jgi:uncharacterized membrane protein